MKIDITIVIFVFCGKSASRLSQLEMPEIVEPPPKEFVCSES
jgi:hypothetical protein